MINFKTTQELDKIVEAGAKLGPVFDFIKPYIKPGVSTLYLDKMCEKFIKRTGGQPSFKKEDGYYWTICASVNQGIIHQIPREDVILKDGDILKIDIGNIDANGFQGDAARTFLVGENFTKTEVQLKEAAEEAFWEAFKEVKIGNHINQIGWAIQKTAEKYGFSCLKEYGGHGIGTSMHEDPFIPNFGIKDHPHGGALIRAGMAICIEPMIIGSNDDRVSLQSDGWGVVSVSGAYTSHYENTIVIYPDKVLVTTVDESVKEHFRKDRNE